MSKISVIVSDLGNVLIPFDYSNFLKSLNSVSTGLGDRFEQKYKSQYQIHQQFERGELSEKEFLKIMMQWTEHLISEERFIEIFSNIFTVNEELTNILSSLKNKYQLILLSNTNIIHEVHGWRKYQFLEIFDKLILSHEVGAIKPEEKIYRAVESFTNKPSEEHFFIDDISDYIKGAQNCGWSGCQYISNSQILNEFKERKIL